MIERPQVAAVDSVRRGARGVWQPLNDGGFLVKQQLCLAFLVTALVPACIVTEGDDDDDDVGGTIEVGEACTDSQECVPGSICYNQFCVGDGMLRISLGFDADSDYDLHVVTPYGNEIYYGNPYADGGELDVDQCISSCGFGSHVENIVFADSAPSGEYLVWVVNYDGRGSGSFEVLVDTGGAEVFGGSLPAEYGASSETFAFSL